MRKSLLIAFLLSMPMNILTACGGDSGEECEKEWDLTGTWTISGTCEDDGSTPEVETSTGIVSQDGCDLHANTSANTVCVGTISGDTITSECLPDDNDPPVSCSMTIHSNTSMSGICSPNAGGPSCNTIWEK